MSEASQLIEKEIGERLVEISGLMLGEEDAEISLKRVTSMACASIPRCDAASVVLVEAGAVDSVLTDAEPLRVVGEIQFQHHDGPSVRAIREGRPHAYSVREEPGSALAEAIIAAGFSTMMAFPLAHGEAAFGTLELYSSAAEPFDEDVSDIGRMFAEQAAIALNHSRLYAASVTLCEQLQEALTSRAVIDQAKGVLMERLGCDADTAFAALREASQRMNRKVRDLAQELVTNAGQPKSKG